MNRNKKKSIQLEMSFGKASHILRKLIMFSLIQETNKDTCFRCNQKIDNIDDLSIEHKIPWSDNENPKGLFFDLNNISFSHILCNIGSAKKTNKILQIEGKYWCWKCDNYKDIKDFPLSRGYMSTTCRTCGNEIKRNWREKTGKH